jgi:hypothetical protein
MSDPREPLPYATRQTTEPLSALRVVTIAFGALLGGAILLYLAGWVIHGVSEYLR